MTKTPTTDEVSAALEVIAEAGINTADIEVAVPTALEALRRANNRHAPSAPVCKHPSGCDQPATHQFQRPATDEEADAHWGALELNIRSHGNPDYTHDRTGDVTVAEHRCDDPEHADAAHLAAVAAAEAYNGARADVDGQLAAFTSEQMQQLADVIRQITGAGK